MFGDRIKDLRVEMKLTQEDIAIKFNISRQAIANWESGLREPSMQNIIELANFYNVSIDYLFGQTSIKENFKANKELEEYINDCIKVYKKHIRA
ncbi:MAG: helix-turn-helix transcriptional regulator [Clostridium sp.]|uniref:helix-turn-helix domain-containing protein n=1 Tax=Clostridium sp. TaxID=1506 RepID=UPI0030654BF5